MDQVALVQDEVIPAEFAPLQNEVIATEAADEVGPVQDEVIPTEAVAEATPVHDEVMLADVANESRRSRKNSLRPRSWLRPRRSKTR